MKHPSMWSKDFIVSDDIWDIFFNNNALELWCSDYILICADDNIHADIKLKRWIINEEIINEIKVDDDNFLSLKNEEFGYFYETPNGKPVRS